MKTRAEKKSAARRTARVATAAGPSGVPGTAVKDATAAGASELVDMGEAITLLKTSRPTFYRWVRSGKLRGMKVGRQWRFRREDLDRFLEGESPRIDLPGNMGPLLATLRGKLPSGGVALPEELAGAAQTEDVQAVGLMIALGFHLRASDIHLEPLSSSPGGDTVAALRYRLDGVLHTLAEFDIRLLRPIVERWKILGGADIHETKRPQDCRLVVSLGGRQLDMRVCIVPAYRGEALTVRLLDAAALRFSLAEMGLPPEDHQRLARFLDRPWGLLVVTGPTGCGKTTVLYACLNQCAKPDVKVMSVEDPVEYILPWVTQLQVRSQLGLTFPAVLRSVLRSDPDIILVGEIRDAESMEVVHQTSLTGHLVMTTLHAEDAAAALMRMVEIGGNAFIVADATKLVSSQRLVRKLCPACSKPAQPSAVALRRATALGKAGGLDWDKLPKAFREPVGCEKCRQTGFKGRMAVIETLEVTPEIGGALRRGASVDELRALAVTQGMTTFVADGIRRAAGGLTSLDEVLRTVVAP